MTELTGTELTEVLYSVYAMIEQYDLGDLDTDMWNRNALVQAYRKLRADASSRGLETIDDLPPASILG